MIPSCAGEGIYYITGKGSCGVRDVAVPGQVSLRVILRPSE